MGRNSLYTPELLEKAEAYITDYEHHSAKFPSIVGLSLYLGIHRDTIHAWSHHEDKSDFSDILGQINSIQHELLIGKGLSGEFNSNIAKLVLGKHKYHDKQDVDHSGSIDLSGKSDEELEDIANGG